MLLCLSHAARLSSRTLPAARRKRSTSSGSGASRVAFAYLRISGRTGSAVSSTTRKLLSFPSFPPTDCKPTKWCLGFQRFVLLEKRSARSGRDARPFPGRAQNATFRVDIPKAQALTLFDAIDNRERLRDEADRIAAQIAMPVARTPVAGAII